MIALALLAATAFQDHAHAFPGGDEAGQATQARGCGQQGEEIVVCGDREQSAFRVRPLPDRYQEKPLRPEVALPGGGTAKAEAVQRGVGGVSVPSAMVTLRIPLGTKRKDTGPAPEAK
ncbi:hypothetical protein ACMGDH_00985 [Sphingomonas sp. DT-207]|uniref:hypothetical protein n=1 Tax=Sphingomonas sp. DT-207 TaxID=3396167 RepID=UPI003F1AC088